MLIAKLTLITLITALAAGGASHLLTARMPEITPSVQASNTSPNWISFVGQR